MPVQRRYVRKYVVGGAGISDFFSSIGRKAKSIFNKIMPHAKKALDTDIGKALLSSGKDLAVAGIKGATTVGVNKIKQKELDSIASLAASEKAAQAAATKKANLEVSEFGMPSVAPKSRHKSEPSDSIRNRYNAAVVQAAPQYVQSGGALTNRQKFALAILAKAMQRQKQKQAQQTPVVEPTGGSIKVQKYAKQIAGHGLRKMY